MHKSMNVLTLCFYLAEVIGLVTMDIAGWAREKRIRNLETVTAYFLGVMRRSGTDLRWVICRDLNGHSLCFEILQLSPEDRA